MATRFPTSSGAARRRENPCRLDSPVPVGRGSGGETMGQTLSKQVRQERLAGVVLIAAAGAALALANSPLSQAYHDLLHFELGPVLPNVGPLTAHAAIADGLMAIFFLLVGMEVKREWIEGRLSSRQARRLPIIAAVAG